MAYYKLENRCLKPEIGAQICQEGREKSTPRPYDRCHSPDATVCWTINKFHVSKETVMLPRREIEEGKFDFIKRVDDGRITTVKYLESWRFERSYFVRANRGIIGCCGFLCGCGGALPLVEIWWDEFVNKLMEWEAFIDSVWIECT